MNGPFGLGSAMATNVMDTGTHALNICGNNVRSFVRASTTVGRNGDNNTLMGTGKRLMNVGSILSSPANTCTKCNFTVPADVVGGIITSLGRFKAMRHTVLNVTKTSLNDDVVRSRRPVSGSNAALHSGTGRFNMMSKI